MTKPYRSTMWAGICAAIPCVFVGIQRGASGGEEEAKRPRMRPYHEIIRAAQNAPPVQNRDCEIIDRTRADMMEAIKKLPRWRRYLQEEDAKGPRVTITGEDAVLLSDIEALAETAK